MFTYSHANTPLGQSERVYYLSYFIKVNIWKNHPDATRSLALTTITGMESNSLRFTVTVSGMLMLKVKEDILPLNGYA